MWTKYKQIALCPTLLNLLRIPDSQTGTYAGISIIRVSQQCLLWIDQMQRSLYLFNCLQMRKKQRNRNSSQKNSLHICLCLWLPEFLLSLSFQPVGCHETILLWNSTFANTLPSKWRRDLKSQDYSNNFVWSIQPHNTCFLLSIKSPKYLYLFCDACPWKIA